jgi:hypothetical protein
MSAPQTLPSRLIGALFVERGLVSESQIRVALEIQRETGQQLGQILVDRFGVSRKELASVVAEQWAKLGGTSGPEDTTSWRRLGDIFVERGFVTQEELDQALTRQRETGERLGEALVAQGVISKFELAGALAEQMAALGDPDAEESEAEQATVHQLPTREIAYGEVVPEADNVVELALAQDGAVRPAAGDTPAPTGDEPSVGAAGADEAHVGPAGVDEAVGRGLAPVPSDVGSEAAQDVREVRDDEVPTPDVGVVDEVSAPEIGEVRAVGEALVPDVGVVDEAFAPGVEVVGAVDGALVPDVGEVGAPGEALEPHVEVVGEVSEALMPDVGAVDETPAPDAGHLAAAAADSVPVAGGIEPLVREDEAVVYADEPEVVDSAAEIAPQPLDALVPAEVDAPATEPDVGEIERSEPAVALFADLHDALPADVSSTDAPYPVPEQRAVCVAFLPTTDGYRLVALESLPEPGEAVDVPDVGEYVVLRVGRSPIPSDDRLCAYAEERVTPPLALAVH